jgi:hypothetical protein
MKISSTFVLRHFSCSNRTRNEQKANISANMFIDYISNLWRQVRVNTSHMTIDVLLMCCTSHRYNNERKHLDQRNSTSSAYNLRRNLWRFVLADWVHEVYFSEFKAIRTCSTSIVVNQSRTTQIVCDDEHVTAVTDDELLSCGSGHESHRQHFSWVDPRR